MQAHSDTKGGNQVILERVLDPKVKTILQWYSFDLQKRLRLFKRFVSVRVDFLDPQKTLQNKLEEVFCFRVPQAMRSCGGLTAWLPERATTSDRGRSSRGGKTRAMAELDLRQARCALLGQLRQMRPAASHVGFVW